MIDYVHEFAVENSFVHRVYGWKRKTYRADFADRLSLLGIVHAVLPEVIYREHENEDDSKDSHLYASKHAFEPVKLHLSNIERVKPCFKNNPNVT